VNIEYHHIVESNAKYLEKEIQKDILQGYRARNQPHQIDKLQHRSKVERSRKDEVAEDMDRDEIKQNKKLELYAQFIPVKSSPKSSQSNERVEESVPKWKTIEFQQRNRSRSKRGSHSLEKSDDDDHSFSDSSI